MAGQSGAFGNECANWGEMKDLQPAPALIIHQMLTHLKDLIGEALATRGSAHEAISLRRDRLVMT